MATSLTTPLSRGAGGVEALSCRRLPSELMPNCIIGYPWSSNWLPPAIAIGTDDFAMEFWHCNMGAIPSGDNNLWSGAFGLDADLVPLYMARLAVQTTTRTLRVWFDEDGTPGGSVEQEAGNMAYGWSHYAVNYDRSGDMELFTNTVSQGTEDISPFVAVDLGSHRFWPASTGEEVGVDEMNSSSDFKWAGAVGPWALHVGTLLTDAQLANSWVNRYVQNLAETQILYDWREIDGMTGWEYDTDNITDGCWAQGVDENDELSEFFGAPIGSGGGVTVRDLSGNGNDLPLPTATSYGTTSLGATNPPVLPTAGTHQAICTIGSSTFFV